ncbi:MAG: hypothetical protein JW820_19150, partial [Spirochaetales bacterium]|nr:hypothetical protein [Spirochaetales bacterium]
QLQAAEKAYADWAESLLVRERSREEGGRLTESRGRLEAELADVERYARSRALRDKRARARELKERWESARAGLEHAPGPSAEQMKELRAASGELQRLEGAVSGGALSLRLEARDGFAVTFVQDLSEPEEKQLEAEESWELTARGRIRLEHRDWSLEVTSGDAGFDEIARRYQAARTRLQGLLQEAGVPNLDAAEGACSRHERLSLEEAAARRAFEETLDGQTWEDLESAAGEQPAGPPRREIETVVAELAEVRAGLGRIEESLLRADQRITSLEGSHENREALLRAIGERSARLQELDRQLAGLQELPEEYGDAPSFLAKHRSREREAQGLREQAAGLESTLQEALRHLPEESAEELASRLSEARRHFQKQKRHGAALLRVREAADGILENLDDSSLEGFRHRFGGYVREMSGARYHGAAEGSLLPEALEREDGMTLRYPLLSTGTRDLFSLALRLAMAEYLLAGSDPVGGSGRIGGSGPAAADEQPAPGGFVVMDDPLVDMDPERQRLAAAALARFARAQQLVVFTCHPSHADVLTAGNWTGGPPVHRIELGKG